MTSSCPSGCKDFSSTLTHRLKPLENEVLFGSPLGALLTCEAEANEPAFDLQFGFGPELYLNLTPWPEHAMPFF